MNTWIVDPSDDWKRQNRSELLEANLPDTPRCPATLTEKQCELRQGHVCSHAITLHVLADVTPMLQQGLPTG